MLQPPVLVDTSIVDITADHNYATGQSTYLVGGPKKTPETSASVGATKGSLKQGEEWEDPKEFSKYDDDGWEKWDDFSNIPENSSNAFKKSGDEFDSENFQGYVEEEIGIIPDEPVSKIMTPTRAVASGATVSKVNATLPANFRIKSLEPGTSPKKSTGRAIACVSAVRPVVPVTLDEKENCHESTSSFETPKRCSQFYQPYAKKNKSGGKQSVQESRGAGVSHEQSSDNWLKTYLQESKEQRSVEHKEFMGVLKLLVEK